MKVMLGMSEAHRETVLQAAENLRTAFRDLGAAVLQGVESPEYTAAVAVARRCRERLYNAAIYGRAETDSESLQGRRGKA